MYRAIAVGLRSRDVEVLTAQEGDRSSISDEMILNRARELNRPVVTTDRDFLVLARIAQKQAEKFPGIFFISSKPSN